MNLRTSIIAAASFIFMLCVWGVVAYEGEHVMSMFGQIDSYRQQIVTDEGQAATAQDLHKAFLGVGDDPHIFDQYFISATDSPDFIGGIETLAQSTGLGVNVGSVDIQQGTGGNDLVMSLSVSGSWTDILRLVRLIELLPYAASVQSIDFESSGAGGQQAAPAGKVPVAGWNADIELSVAAQ